MPFVVAALLVSAVFLLRLPAQLVSHEFDVDESQAINQGMKLLVDSRPWTSIDGQSCGPLHSYAITAALLLGFKPGFVLAHLLANLLIALQVLVAYLTLRRIASDRIALLGGALLVFIYGLSARMDYLHYAGELWPSLFLVVGFYLFALWLSSESQSRGALLSFLAGLALGMAPWCKLQAGPISAALIAVFLLAIFRRRDIAKSMNQRLLEAGALLIGSVLTTCITILALQHTGALGDFWYSYVLGNVQYASSTGLLGVVRNAGLMLRMPPVIHLVLFGVCVFLYWLAVGDAQSQSPRQRWAWAATLVYCAATLFSVGRVHYPFPHHTLFLIAPITYLVMLTATRCPAGLASLRHPQRKWAVGLLIFAVAITSALYAGYAIAYVRLLSILHSPDTRQSSVATASPDSLAAKIVAEVTGSVIWESSDSNERIAAALHQVRTIRPVESLAVWGWAPGVYVVSGIPSTSRDSDSYFQIGRGPLQQYYRSRYVADLRAHPPDVFIDAVAPGAFLWPSWTARDSYESIPELRSFVQQNYELAAELTLQPGTWPVRLFVRRDLQ